MRRAVAGAAGLVLLASAAVLPAAATARGVGRKLADGFVVAKGSRLAGTVFRSAKGAEGDSEWSALLVVDEDPIDVFDAYVAQARALGYLMSGSGVSIPGGPGVCNWAFADRSASYLPGTGTNAEALECSSGAAVDTAEGGTFVELSVRWGGTTHHAYLRVSHSPDPYGLKFPDLGSARATPPARLPALTAEKLPRKPRQPFGVRNDGYYSNYRRPALVSGSRVAAQTAFIDNQDFVAVLRVDGDIDSVLERYARQLGGGHTDVQHGKTTTGDYVAYFDTSPDGGGSGTMLGDPTGRWILAHTHSD